MVLLRRPLKRRPPVVKATGRNEVKPGDKGVNAEPRSLPPRLSYTLVSNPIWQSHNRITKAGPLANQSHASSHPYSLQSSSASAAGNTRARTSARLLKPADHSSRCEDTTPARNLVGCGANSQTFQGVSVSFWENSEGHDRPQGRREPPTTAAEAELHKVPPQVPRVFAIIHTDEVHVSPHNQHFSSVFNRI